MPIRKRISDPMGRDVKIVERNLAFGRPPPKPKRPRWSGDAKPLGDALVKIPVNHIIKRTDFVTYTRKYTKEFELYGITLDLYPCYDNIIADDGHKVCTGVLVTLHVANRPKSLRPKMLLRASNEKGIRQERWLGVILDWIEREVYGKI